MSLTLALHQATPPLKPVVKTSGRIKLWLHTSTSLGQNHKSSNLAFFLITRCLRSRFWGNETCSETSGWKLRNYDTKHTFLWKTRIIENLWICLKVGIPVLPISAIARSSAACEITRWQAKKTRKVRNKKRIFAHIRWFVRLRYPGLQSTQRSRTGMMCWQGTDSPLIISRYKYSGWNKSPENWN